MSGNTITNYDSLVTAVQDYLARSDITDSNYAPEIIQAAQNNIYYGYTDNKGNYLPGLRVRQMEKAFPGGSMATSTLVGGTGYSQGDTIAFDAAPAGGITMTGTLYISTPTGPSGPIKTFIVTNPGLGYLTAPNSTITTAGGTGGSVTVTISGGPVISPGNSLTVPPDYLDTKYLNLFGSTFTGRLERKPAEWLYNNYANGNTGIPNYFARDGGVFIFGPQADDQYTLGGIYYQKQELVSSTNETDWMTDDFPHLLLYSCLAEASSFIRDKDMMTFWQNKMTSVMATIQMADKREGYSGSPLAMVPG